MSNITPWVTDLDAGIFKAHQSVWSKIKESGKVGFILESDAVLGAPLDNVIQPLRNAANSVRASERPAIVIPGHCGIYCLQAYFMNPEAAEVAANDAKCCSLPDVQIYHHFCCSADSNNATNGTSKTAGLGMHGPRCEKPGPVECKWNDDVLFVQNRTIKGTRDADNIGIADPKQIETFASRRNRTLGPMTGQTRTPS